MRLALPTRVRGNVFQIAHLPAREEITRVKFKLMNYDNSLCITTPRYLNWETICNGVFFSGVTSAGDRGNNTDLPQLMQILE